MRARLLSAFRAAGFAGALSCCVGASAQDGSYDDHFGNYLPGRTLHQSLEDSLEGAYALAVLPDGRLVLAGSSQAIRLGESGVPDAGFGNDAFDVDGVFAVQPFGTATGFLAIEAVLRQADGKLLFAGSAEATDLRMHYVVCRTSADGQLDAGYGDAGCASYQVEAGTSANATAAALDDAGRVVLVGDGYFSFGAKMVVVRFRSDGLLDTSFGTNGRSVILRFGEIGGSGNYDKAEGIAIDLDGSIVVVGDTGPANVHDFAIARLRADGLLDTTFGDGGARIVDFAGQQETDVAYAVTFQRNGRILVAGYASYAGTQPGMALLGVTPDGDVDVAFGNLGGRSIVWPFASSNYAFATALAVQQDGRIVLGGYALNPAGGDATGQDMAIVRLHADGSGPDTGFASSGVFTGGFDLGTEGETSNDDRLHALRLQGNRIIAVGGARANWPNSSFAAIRLNEDRLFEDGWESP
jgi:uncharacterized delta-60 repeat protein